MAIPTIDDVPISLMPITAAAGFAAAVLMARALYTIWKPPATLSSPRSRGAPPTSPASPLPLLILAAAVCVVVYSYTLGKIQGAYQKAEFAQFDPYAELEVAKDADPEAITAAYRALLPIYHPSNTETGDADKLRSVMDAYRVLTDEDIRRQWERHGHPQGPLLTPMFLMAPPRWLWTPPASVQYQVYAVYLMLSAVFVWAFRSRTLATADVRDDEPDTDLDYESNNVPVSDFWYLSEHIRPDSQHFDILYLVLSAPGNIAWATKDLRRIEDLRAARQAEVKKSTTMDFDSLMDEGGWAEDEDDDQTRKEEEEKKQKQEQFKAATGQAGIMLEGIDDGVLGQKWVERTLASVKQWPPKDLAILEGRKFTWDGKEVSALDHPAVRRMLCMMTGRIHSHLLNSHPELLAAGTQKKIDQTYFQASLAFRHRAGLLLEAVLRISSMTQCYRLMKTAVEAVAIFKIGCPLGQEEWFKELMQRQYGIRPALAISNTSVSTPGEADMATGEKIELAFEGERVHAENFLRQKLATFEKQGIPPQAGLQSYREGWWIMLRCERLDGETKPPQMDEKELKEKLKLTDAQIAMYEREDPKQRLLAGFPVVIGQVQQKTVKGRIQLKAPAVPGKYKFTVDIMSHDFLGADVQFEVTGDVVDASTVVRVKKDDESKKDR